MERWKGLVTISSHRRARSLSDTASTTAIRLLLLWRLVGRPLLRETSRAWVTTLCVAIGVAVVVAIDLAGEAAAGSFRSSMESLRGDAGYEISRVGGIPDSVFGDLARLPVPLEFSARVEDYALLPSTGQRLPLFGVDLLGDERVRSGVGVGLPALGALFESRPAWVPQSLGLEPGDPLDLVIGDRLETFTVQGMLTSTAEAAGTPREIVVVDIALAQQVVDRIGLLDRIYVYGRQDWPDEWMSMVGDTLPAGASIEAAGTRTQESRKLLKSFRWNLQVLSYIALIVGALLVYNAVSVSVVRRRVQIGIARALGATKGMVRNAFLAEGCFFGAVGTALGLAGGRLLATVALQLMGQTVTSLYVSSEPGEIEIRPWTVGLALLAGWGVCIASAWWPATEAASIPPAEALARSRRDYEVRRSRGLWTMVAIGCAVLSAILCLLPDWDRVPYAGFAAAFGLILAMAMATPAFAAAILRAASGPLHRLLGPAALLGIRSLAGSLGRTAVIVAALAAATGMMVSVGIMVGSLRETMLVWMERQLQADLYIQAESRPGVGGSATFAEDAARAIEALPSVEAVDRLRRYSISYRGLPAGLAVADFRVLRDRSGMRFLDGRDPADVADILVSSDSVIVSEAFSTKHRLEAGDSVVLPIGSGEERFRVAGVYYDYSGEQGFVLGHREVLMRHLPDSRLTGAAVYATPGAEVEVVRQAVMDSVRGHRVHVTRTAELRDGAAEIFDRTFAITYALEAIAVFVAILGLSGAVLTLVLDRRAEFGVLRAVGAARGQVRRLVLVQAGMLGLAANILGCILGWLLSIVLIKVINKQSFGWTIQFHWPVAILVGAIGLIFAATLLAGTYPARIAAAHRPTDASAGE